ncbi:MAG: PilX N-terminal domain-containing pilus assembly protein [Pseudomonadota bacterium]
MLLLIVTLLGLAGIRGAMLQERMAANAYARAQAFQAAEAALREGETVVQAQWEANNDWVPDGKTKTVATTLNDITSQYSIEIVGPANSAAGPSGSSSTSNPDLKDRIVAAASGGGLPNPGKVYRVIATSTNPDNGVEVQLESLYELSRE